MSKDHFSEGFLGGMLCKLSSVVPLTKSTIQHSIIIQDLCFFDATSYGYRAMRPPGFVWLPMDTHTCNRRNGK